MLRSIVLSLALLTTQSRLSAKVSDWQEQIEAFRTAYPYHIQVVALAEPNAEGRRLLIFSEPPPWVSGDDLKNISPDKFEDVSFPRHKLGYDGWIQDAAIELKPMSPEELAEIVDQIHLKAFGTTYKAVAVRLPVTGSGASKRYQLDLHVSAGMLKRWLLPGKAKPSSQLGWLGLGFGFFLLALLLIRRQMGQNWIVGAICLLVITLIVAGVFWQRTKRTKIESIAFVSQFGSDKKAGEELLARGEKGVFYSDRPGLVLWLLPRHEPLNQFTRSARMFAVDSDLILGAVATQDTLAIIARERIAPTDVLPPLRTETILQLAAVKDVELGQSYERNYLFAGKFDGKNDWAPIYLSETLIDSEYGSLLNIADQLLKSWSMSGTVRYDNFNYPEPAKYPFPTPLATYVNTHHLTFNWNTKGAGYSSDFGNREILAWTRTGALPVDYLGDSNDRLRDAEEVGFHYFAESGDPTLARVVQYAELYQIFQRFGITASGESGSGRSTHPRFLDNLTYDFLNRFARASDRAFEPRDGYTPHPALASCKQTVAQLISSGDAQALGSLSSAVVAPRELGQQTVILHDAREIADFRQQEQIAKFVSTCEAAFQSAREVLGPAIGNIFHEYVANSERVGRSWIHTPSVVVSQTSGEGWVATGGHNLNSTVTDLRVSSAVRSGEIRVTNGDGNKKIFEFNPADEDRIQDVVRPIARKKESDAPDSKDIRQLAAEVLKNARHDDRNLAEVLAVPERRAETEERGLVVADTPTDSAMLGWNIRRKRSSEQSRIAKALESPKIHSVVVDRDDKGHYAIYDAQSESILTAVDRPSAVDAVSELVGRRGGTDKIHLYFPHFEEREAHGFKVTAEFQLQDQKGWPTIVGSVVEGEVGPSELKALLFERSRPEDVEVDRQVERSFDKDGGMIAQFTVRVKELIFKVTMVFRAGVTMSAEAIEAMRISIGQMFGEILTRDPETVLLTSVFQRRMKEIDPNIQSIQLKVSRGARNFYIVDERTFVANRTYKAA